MRANAAREGAVVGRQGHRGAAGHHMGQHTGSGALGFVFGILRRVQGDVGGNRAIRCRRRQRQGHRLVAPMGLQSLRQRLHLKSL